MATAIAKPITISEEELIEHELRRIQTLRAQVVIYHPFWATLLLPMTVELSAGIPTFAATDCVSRIWINPFWTYHLSLKQLGYILIHEVGHIVFLTASRRLTRDHHRWNDATDYAINAILDDLMSVDGKLLYERPDMKIPEFGVTLRPLYNKDFKELVAEEIYEKLESEEPETCPRCGQKHAQQGQSQGGGAQQQKQQTQEAPSQGGAQQPQNGDSKTRSGKTGPGRPNPHQGDPSNQDNCPGEGQNPGQDGSQGQQPGTGQTDGNQDPGCPNADGNGGGTRVPDFNGHCRPGQTDMHLPPDLTETQVQNLIDGIINAQQIWNASNQRGSMPAGLSRFIQKLREARVPWERVVQQYAGTALAKEDFSLYPPHSRWLQYDIIRPTLRSEAIALLGIAVDSSGSTQPVLEEFAAEMTKLHTLAEDCIIITCDAEIHQVVKTREVPEFLRTLKIKGGGGTSHVPVFDWFTKNHMVPDLLVALTDLDSVFPAQKPGYPVLWCVPEGRHGDGPGWGKIVVIPNDAGRKAERS